MINISLLTMQEYQPKHNEELDVYIMDKQFRAIGLSGIFLKRARCEITYQMVSAAEGIPLSSWTSDTIANMEKIPFNTPFLHTTESQEPKVYCHGGKEVEKITGFRLLSPDELFSMKQDSKVGTYNIKVWYLCLGDHQIWHDDPDKEVLGIMDKEALYTTYLKPQIVESLKV